MSTAFRGKTFVFKACIALARSRSLQTAAFVSTFGCAIGAFAKAPSSPAEKIIEVAVGGSQTIRVPTQLDRVVVGDPTICDVVPLPPGQLLLTAKIAGETQITVWSREGGVSFYHISAVTPVGVLQQALREAFPAEEDLQVHAAGGAVYLTGVVGEASVVEAAHRLAVSLVTGTGKKMVEVINLTTVAATQQVQLQLRFVDVSRTSLRQIGFNAWYSGAQENGALFGPNDAHNYNDTTQSFYGPAPNYAQNMNLPILTSPVQGAFALSFASGRAGPISATLSLMEGKGVAKTLSEPTLVASSGEAAHFIVGGEFPIPVPDPLGRVIVQFKPYGTQLEFTPTVIGQDTIHLALNATVSDIDKQNAVTVGSSSVPGITTRQSSTSVRMHDGQSFAIAGLVTDRITANNHKIPILGDIPLVGALFRNDSYTRSEEELVVLVSARLVKPMEAGEVPPILHEDEFSDPNDLQLFLLGISDLTKPQLGNATQAGPAARKSSPVRSVGTPGGVVGFSR
jgi:pilus assembly protein CpaC